MDKLTAEQRRKNMQAVRATDHKSNKEFWLSKIERNIERDKEVNDCLQREGWTVLRFWGKEITANLEECIIKVQRAINEKDR